MMPQRHRLRRLEVSEPRHHAGGMFLRPRQQGAAQSGQCRQRLVDRVAHPQPEIGRDLIVAAARGMEASRDRADRLGEPRLGLHVDVLEREVLRRTALLVILAYAVEPHRDRRRVLGRHDSACTQHRDVRLGARDVLPPQPFVEGN
jgi:hypothetical protein